MDGVLPIMYTIENPDTTAEDRAFSDGMWHSIELSLSTNKLEVIADGVKFTTIQFFSKPVSLDSIIVAVLIIIDGSYGLPI